MSLQKHLTPRLTLSLITKPTTTLLAIPTQHLHIIRHTPCPPFQSCHWNLIHPYPHQHIPHTHGWGDKPGAHPKASHTLLLKQSALVLQGTRPRTGTVKSPGMAEAAATRLKRRRTRGFMVAVVVVGDDGITRDTYTGLRACFIYNRSVIHRSIQN